MSFGKIVGWFCLAMAPITLLIAIVFTRQAIQAQKEAAPAEAEEDDEHDGNGQEPPFDRFSNN